MMIGKGSGFVEVEHTADWALMVWAPEIEALFEQAARGMAWLLQMSLEEGPRVTRELALEAMDDESLLVTFLSELLYLAESENLGFDRYTLEINAHKLSAMLYGAPLRGQKKEIKAVTYHNLEIRRTGQGCMVTVVFDV